MATTTVRPSQILNVPIGANLVALLKADPTENSVSNSTTETTMGSVSVPGGMLGINDALWISAYADDLQNSAVNQTHTWRLKYGGTTLVTLSVVMTADASTPYGVQMTALLKNVGATNSQRGTLGYYETTRATGNNLVSATLSGTSAIDSTAAQTLSITVQCGTVTATQTVTARLFVVHYLKNT